VYFNKTRKNKEFTDFFQFFSLPKLFLGIESPFFICPASPGRKKKKISIAVIRNKKT
jgi:hypothetical protein